MNDSTIFITVFEYFNHKQTKNRGEARLLFQRLGKHSGHFNLLWDKFITKEIK